jgi:hypothetical protein
LTKLTQKSTFQLSGEEKMSHYPVAFPTVEAQHLYQMVSSGTLRDNIPHATHDLWWVGGFLAKYAVGEPDNHGAAPTEESASAAIAADCTPAELVDLQNLSVLAGLTIDDLAQPGQDPAGILDKIDLNNLLSNIQKVVALLKLLGLIP